MKPVFAWRTALARCRALAQALQQLLALAWAWRVVGLGTIGSLEKG